MLQHILQSLQKKKGARIVATDNTHVSVQSKNIVDNFDFPITKKINGREYVLAKVITICNINDTGTDYEEITIQGDIPKDIDKREVKWTIHVDSRDNRMATKKGMAETTKVKFSEVSIQAGYIPII